MSNQSVMWAGKDPHTYGLKAAARSNKISEMLFKSNQPTDLIEAISLIKEYPDPGLHDRAMDGLLHFSRTGDRAAAKQMIHSYLYLVANLNLGRQMHAVQVRYESQQIEIDLPELDQIQSYPQHDETREPVFISMVDVLLETSMPSHAPCAAIERSSLQSISI